MHFSDQESQDSEEAYAEDERIISELSPILRESMYACGGTIVIGEQAPNRNDNVTGPVTIRWDAGERTHRLNLPFPSMTARKTKDAALQKLVHDMQPASFGFKGKDIIDETYRKAVKLNTSVFASNFCPYKAGIIDIVGQALLPIKEYTSQGIYADLYKLNIYEGPSGMFKPHVDTPRSDLQFGSLGRSTVFDWANNSKNIHWAAFYGDCEHKVAQVVSGHRITLTYNLHLRRGVGELCGFNTRLNIQELPAYREMKKALSNPLFFSEGGTLGARCSHAYAHTTDKGINSLPGALKGSDMVLFEVARALGLVVDIRPQIDYSRYDQELDAEHCNTNLVGENLTVPHGTDMGGSEGYDINDILAEFPTEHGRIKWLWNNPIGGKHLELQFVHLCYGNQAEVDFAYSYCTLLLRIPSYDKRLTTHASHKPGSCVSDTASIFGKALSKHVRSIAALHKFEC